MTTRKKIFVLLLTAIFAASSPVFAQDLKVTEKMLGNGLKVLMKEEHKSPVVTFQVWYKVGSRNEKLGKTGISHALEHMMFKGTRKEISHLANGNSKPPATTGAKDDPPKEPPKTPPDGKPGNGGSGGNGDARISNKQLNYIVTLGKSLKLNSKDLDQECVNTFGVKMAFLTTKQASAFIDTLKERST